MDYFHIMNTSCKDINLEFNEYKYDQFMNYMTLLKEWNEKINLTSITEDEQIVKKHFIDCMKIFKFSPLLTPSKKIIDIGSGAGFPGIPMKIIFPDSTYYLLDSLNKRVNFLNQVVSNLNLSDINAIHGRAEDFARNIEYREKFDFAVSRAVANLSVLAEISLPFVNVGGYFVAMKGPSVENEIASARNALGILGGKLEDIIEVNIEDTDLKHNIVIIKKVKKSSNAYPRKAGVINKKPL